MGLIFPTLAGAQTANRVSVVSPDLSDFPNIAAYLDIRNDRGDFVPGLTLENLTILEDGIVLPVDEVQEIQSTLSVVVALNSGTPLGIRNDDGYTRIDLVAEFVKGWVGSLEETYLDDLSLVTASGEPVLHTTDVGEWMSVWETETNKLNAAQPSLDVLGRAIDVAGDTSGDPSVGRVVFFITPTFNASMAANIQDMADRAIQSNIRVFVLVVDSDAFFVRTSSQELQSLAFQTGGQFSAFSGGETLPNLIAWINPVRMKYHFSYRSQINTSGAHQIVARVQSPLGEMISDGVNIDLQLQPPNPIFLSLPAEIIREIPEQAEIAVENLEPKQSQIEVLFDFPDGIQREIIRTVLYLNDQVVSENNEPPFEVFDLNLDPYQSNQRIILRVEAWDELGLVGSSLDTPIDIMILVPEQSIWSAILRNGPFLAVGVISISGAVLFLILVLAGRVRPLTLGERTGRKRKKELDPVTQSVENILNTEELAPSRLTKFARRLPTRRQSTNQKSAKVPQAYLVRVSDREDVDPGNIISIMSSEVTFGSNPIQATITLDDPAIEELHARLYKNGDGGYYLSDQGSVAGTWINYAPVTNGGVRVEHGDLLHIAKIGFRFTLHKPEKVTRPKVIPLKDKEA